MVIHGTPSILSHRRRRRLLLMRDWIDTLSLRIHDYSKVTTAERLHIHIQQDDGWYISSKLMRTIICKPWSNSNEKHGKHRPHYDQKQQQQESVTISLWIWYPETTMTAIHVTKRAQRLLNDFEFIVRVIAMMVKTALSTARRTHALYQLQDLIFTNFNYHRLHHQHQSIFTWLSISLTSYHQYLRQQRFKVVHYNRPFTSHPLFSETISPSHTRFSPI